MKNKPHYHVEIIRSFLIFLLSVYCPTLLAQPTINSISPFFGQPGDVVTITGSGFNSDPAANEVRFGPNRAPVLSASGNSLRVQVPHQLGTTQATVTVDGDASNSIRFIVYTNFKNLDDNPHECATCNNSFDGWLGADLGGLSGNIYADRGEFFQRVTDYTLPGRSGAHPELHYRFSRHYRSKITDETALGHNWNHNYFEHFVIQIDGSIVHDNGLDRKDRYRVNNQGEFVAPAEFFTRLTKQADDSFVLERDGVCNPVLNL